MSKLNYDDLTVICGALKLLLTHRVASEQTAVIIAHAAVITGSDDVNTYQSTKSLGHKL